MPRPIRASVACAPRARPGLTIVAALLGFAAWSGAALAQEPLFLRIRPPGDTPDGPGRAGPSDDDIVRAARARSEAVWQRAEQRSRIAIASVCTGCIPTAPIPRPAPSLPDRPVADGPTPIAADPPAPPIPPLAQAESP